MAHPRRFIVPTLAVLTTAIALAAFSALSIDWAAWRPATCLPNACFCEAIGDGTIRQPINTWSNLAFVWVGVWVLGDLRLCQAARRGLRLKSKADSENTLKRVSTRFVYQPSNSFDGAAAKIFGGACIAIGLGSWFYHASLSFMGQWFDVMSMYLLGTFMVLYAARRLIQPAASSFPRASGGNPAAQQVLIANRHTGCPIKAFGHDARKHSLRSVSDRTFAIGYVVINVGLGVLLVVWPDARRYVFGGLIIVALALETILQRRHLTIANPRWLIASLAVYVVAQVIWTLDLNHIVCDPTSVFQGHAVWHVLTALSAGLVYGYYQAEDQSRLA